MTNSDLTATAAAMCALLLDPTAHKATKYLTPKRTVRATRIGRFDRREKRSDFRITIGAPNYADRKFIKQCQRAGETFPLRRIQLKFPPKRK